jgi:hypothetical protein
LVAPHPINDAHISPSQKKSLALEIVHEKKSLGLGKETSFPLSMGRKNKSTILQIIMNN